VSSLLVREQVRLGLHRDRRHLGEDGHLLDPLADLHQLRRAGARMPVDPSPLGPGIGLVVMVDVAEQQAPLGPMHDQPDVPVDPHRPERGVLRPLQLVELEPRMGWVQLEVERRGLDRLLLLPRQAGQAVGEGVGDPELHHGLSSRSVRPM
jgi:hypothetical protein